MTSSKEFLRDANARDLSPQVTVSEAFSHFSTGLGALADLQELQGQIISGNLDNLDTSKLALRTTSARLINDLMTSINTQDVQEPYSGIRGITRSIKEVEISIRRIQELAEHLAKLVEEIASFDVSDVGVDLLEIGMEGIPGVTKDELRRMIGQ